MISAYSTGIKQLIRMICSPLASGLRTQANGQPSEKTEAQTGINLDKALNDGENVFHTILPREDPGKGPAALHSQ